MHVSTPFVPCQVPWDDLELGRLIRDDAGGRTYRATFQGACATAKVCRLHALRLQCCTVPTCISGPTAL